MSFAIGQFLVLGFALLWAIWHTLGQFAPMVRARIQNHAALWCLADDKPVQIRRLGLRLLPRVTQHCGTSCDKCGVCK